MEPGSEVRLQVHVHVHVHIIIVCKLIKNHFLAVFPPDWVIAGIPLNGIREGPQNKKDQFGPFFLQARRPNTGVVF